MSDMTGNPYAERVEKKQTHRLPEAMLALAFEQRTANLIAFYDAIPRDAMDRSTRKLRANIMDRLGLGDES